jgi:hypothetical protein
VDKAVTYVSAYWLDVRDSIPGRGRKLHLCHYIQNDFETNAAIYALGAWGSYSVSGLIGSNAKLVTPYPVASSRMLEVLRPRDVIFRHSGNYV